VRQFIRIQGLKGIRVLCLVLWFPSMLWANEAYQMKPIDYDNSEAVDVISAYFKEASHLKTWEGPGRTDYLYSFLEAFDIPVESQVLVFSKTSLQASRISPRTPRAIYFNDEIYVAWVPNGNRLEVSVPSPRTGTNFYTIRDDQGRPVKPIAAGVATVIRLPAMCPDTLCVPYLLRNRVVFCMRQVPHWWITLLRYKIAGADGLLQVT